jgi:hypothetical protein
MRNFLFHHAIREYSYNAFNKIYMQSSDNCNFCTNINDFQLILSGYTVLSHCLMHRLPRAGVPRVDIPTHFIRRCATLVWSPPSQLDYSRLTLLWSVRGGAVRVNLDYHRGNTHCSRTRTELQVRRKGKSTLIRSNN